MLHQSVAKTNRPINRFSKSQLVQSAKNSTSMRFVEFKPPQVFSLIEAFSMIKVVAKGQSYQRSSYNCKLHCWRHTVHNFTDSMTLSLVTSIIIYHRKEFITLPTHQAKVNYLPNQI